MSVKTNYFKGIRTLASAANKEFYNDSLNLSKVCNWWKQESVSNPERDYFLFKLQKYLTSGLITPKFCVENSNDVINNIIVKRKRIETAESTEEVKKYKFILSDVPRTLFSPSFVANCCIIYANKQAALIASQNVSAPNTDNTIIPKVETDTLQDAANKVTSTAKVVENNKKRIEATILEATAK